MSSSLTSLLQTLRIVPMTHTKLQSPTSIASVSNSGDKLSSIPGSSSSSIPKLAGSLPEITLEEIAHHDSYEDCWIVIYDRVYDVTQFLLDHPGGVDVIVENAGRDATLAFHGTGHSRDAIAKMREFLIGELPVQQRIFRAGNGARQVISLDIPE